ncbi:MAG: Phage-associated protease [Rhodospirillales bacterium]|nr:Phage-associated protease [Rhodospirillales bacterium]
MFRNGLMMSGSRAVFAPADEGTGGSAVGAAAAVGGAAPDAAAAAAAAAPTSILETPPAEGAAAAADAGAVKTAEEDKTGTKEGVPPADETPEAKAEREKAETEAKTAEVLKTYEALKLPGNMPVDAAKFDATKQTFAKLGLSAEQAQTLLDEVSPTFREAIEAPMKAWGDTQEKWIGEVKSDKEFGGDIPKAAGVARRGIEALMGDRAQAVIQTLAYTGAGNNPDVFRAFFRVGKQLGEGSFVGGKGAPADKKSAGAIMYPNLVKE